MIPSDWASPLVGMAGLARHDQPASGLLDASPGGTGEPPGRRALPAERLAGQVVHVLATDANATATMAPARHPSGWRARATLSRLSTICTCCPIRTTEPSHSTVLTNPAGPSASEQTYC